NKPTIKRFILGRDLNLPEEIGSFGGRLLNLVFKPDHELIIKSQDRARPCTIRIGYPQSNGEDMDTKPWIGLVIARGNVTFQDIRFELDGVPPTLQQFGLAALALRGGSLRLTRCLFRQPGDSQPPVRDLFPEVQTAMIAVQGSRLNRPELAMQSCYFENGQSAVSLMGRAGIRVEDCAFGPHNVLFHLRGNSPLAHTALSLNHCSACVREGTVFRLDHNAACSFHVRSSIFSCLPGGSGCYLILQTGSPEPREEVRYVAERNCYHNLNFFWTHYPPRPLAPDFQRNSFADFLQQLKDTEGKDERSEVLDSTVNPWEKSNP